MLNSYNLSYLPEKLFNSQSPITMRATKRYEKKITATCKIITGDKSNGTGFFCELKINNKLMKMLFTNNHVLNQFNSNIKIEHNRKRIEINIQNRFIFTNEDLDYTAIQILDSDNFDNFFHIEKNINCKHPEEEYKYDEFVIIQYPGGDDVSFAEGYLNEINDYSIFHSINTEPGSSGSPILLDTRHLKVIGIHCGKTKDLNRGVYMTKIIEDIEKKILDKKKEFNLCKEVQSNNQQNKDIIDSSPKNIKPKKNQGKINDNKKHTQIKKFSPKRKYEYDNKEYELYSEEQFIKNKESW